MVNKPIIKSEKEFKNWFMKNYSKLGYSKIVRSDISRCPDFIMLRDGKEIGVELETLSSNFVMHKHDLNKVDEIVCMVKDLDLGKSVLVADEVQYDGPIKVTLSINERVYSEFKKYCEDNAIMLSKKIELVMQDIMGNKKMEKKDK